MTMIKYKRFIGQCDISLVESNDLNKSKVLGELKDRVSQLIETIYFSKILEKLSKSEVLVQLTTLRQSIINIGMEIEDEYEVNITSKYNNNLMVIADLLTIKFEVISESFSSDELLVDFPTFIETLDEEFNDEGEQVYYNLENYLSLHLKNNSYLKNDLTEIGNDLNSSEAVYICTDNDFACKYGFDNISYIESEYIEALIDGLNELFPEQYPSSFELKDRILNLLGTRLRHVEAGYDKIRFDSIYDGDLPFIVKLNTTDLLVFIDNELQKSAFEKKFKKIGIDQKEFCSLTGVTQQTVSRWKRDTSYPTWLDFALIGLSQHQLNKTVSYANGTVTKVATYEQFDDFEFEFSGYDSEYPSILQFRCKQDSDFDLKAFRGDDDELPWVAFKNDYVGVLICGLNFDSQYALSEDDSLLNIDATPQVIADSLELFKY